MDCKATHMCMIVKAGLPITPMCMLMLGCAIFKLLLYSAFSVLFCSRNISIMLCMCIICCDMCIDCCACHCCIIIGSIDGS